MGDPALNHSSSVSTRWRDANVENSWGRRKRNGYAWMDGNCLKACIATLLQRDIKTVPDPTTDFPLGDGWLDAYQERLKPACRVRLEKIPAGGCPPIDRRDWIPALDAGAVNHAVIVNGQSLIKHDPNQ